MQTQIFEQWESEVRGYSRTYPTVFVKAQNARQIDEDGKSYIDFFAGAGVLNFGHNNARMKKAMIELLESDGPTQSLDMYTAPKRAFIEKFAKTILEPRKMTHRMQFVGPTGTNAVEASLKLARKVTGRRTVVAFAHGFHGMTLGSLACTTNEYFRNVSGVPLEHVVHRPFGCEPKCAKCKLGCGVESLDEFRALLADGSGGVPKPAAFLVEPIQAEGGVRVASKEWLLALQQLARDIGALVIYDDIQAACGRTGSYFSFDGMGVDPDIICLAKGLGGYGTPMAMNLIKPEYDKQWSPGEHTGTFRGQGLSFVAGKVALAYFEDDTLMGEVRAKGEVMRAALDAIANKHAKRGFEVRGKGMMQGIDLDNSDLSKRIVADCFKRGLLIGSCSTGGRILKLIPPLTIPDEDLRAGLEILTAAFDANLEG